MAHSGPLWLQEGSYSATADRQLLSALWPAGGVSAGVVSAVTNTMTVSVAPGSAAVRLQTGQGSALCVWDTAEVLPLTASPPSGQSRYDVVVCQVRDNALDGGANNDFVLAVVQGTASASAPAVPATPSNALAMATVTVPGGAANLNGATLVDQRVGQLAVLGPQGSLMFQSGPLTFGATAQPITPMAVASLRAGMTSNGTTLTVPNKGIYRVSWQMQALASGPNTYVQLLVTKNGATVATATAYSTANGQYVMPSSAAELPFNAGDAIGISAQCPTNSCQAMGYADNKLLTGISVSQL